MCDFPSKMSHFESFSSHPLLSSFNSKPFSNHCMNLGHFFSPICRIGNTNGHLRVFSLRSTEGFCEKLHNGPLKPVIPVGKLETGEWLKAIYPYLPRYKMPPWVDSELVYRQPAKEIWWSSDIQRAKGVSFIRWDTISFLETLSYPKICFVFFKQIVNLLLQHLTMASFVALLLSLPVALTCAPQKAGKDQICQEAHMLSLSYETHPELLQIPKIENAPDIFLHVMSFQSKI